LKRDDILKQLPERIRSEIKIEDKNGYWHIYHGFIEDEPLFAETRETIEKVLGGRYQGYYGKEAHYEIPKGVTPVAVVMDETKAPEFEEQSVKLVSVTKIVASPWWPRQKEADTELVESIQKFGVRQNLEARPRKDGKLELVYGHRRLYAAIEAGVQVVPVKIRGLSDEEALMVQFEENDKQKTWTDMETARYLRTMMEKLECKTQKELAQKIGKKEPWISRHLALEKIAPGQFLLGEPKFPIEEGKFTERQGRELLKAPMEKREEILKEAEKEGVLPSARKIEARVRPSKVCEYCRVASDDVKEWNNHGILLCEKHRLEADKFPEKFLGLKRSRETVSKMRVVKPPPKVEDTWTNRKARMQPQHSKMEDTQLLKLQEASLRPVIRDREFCIKSTTPDLFFPNKKLAIYLDGPVHEGKEERDDARREALAKQHGVIVVSIPYQACSGREVEEVFSRIKEAYDNA